MAAVPQHLPLRPVRHSTRAGRWMGSLAHGFVVAWLFVSTSALFPLLSSQGLGGISADDRAVLRLLLLPTLVAAPLALLAHGRPIGALLLRQPWLPLLLLWVWASTAWSLDPGVTARRALQLTATTVLACYLVVAYPPRALVRLLFYLLAGIVVGSVLIWVVRPDAGFMAELGAFRGLFTHKNGMGFHLVLAGLVACAALRSGCVRPGHALALLALVVVLLVPTRSATAILMMVVVGLTYACALAAALPGRSATVALALAALAALALAVPLTWAQDQILLAVGRDETLTGRTELWDYVRSLIWQRPFHGHGYAAFFEQEAVSDYLLHVVGWGAPNAHNGYLETWLGLGVVGLLLTLAFLATGLLRAVGAVLARRADPLQHLAFFFLPVYLIRNASESDLVQQSFISWVVAVVAVLGSVRAAAVARSRGEERRRGEVLSRGIPRHGAAPAR